jgi:hypothetical protein
MLAIASALAIAIVAGTSLHAENPQEKSMPNTTHDGMMERTGQMRQMMEGCAAMMGMRGSRSEKPNDQWRTPTPGVPEKKR